MEHHSGRGGSSVPDAVGSDYVKIEYLRAHTQKKPMIPLYYRACDIPMLLAPLQLIDFRTAPYDKPLQNLLKAIESKISK